LDNAAIFRSFRADFALASRFSPGVASWSAAGSPQKEDPLAGVRRHYDRIIICCYPLTFFPGLAGTGKTVAALSRWQRKITEILAPKMLS
jgi:hypothetical protein